MIRNMREGIPTEKNSLYELTEVSAKLRRKGRLDAQSDDYISCGL